MKNAVLAGKSTSWQFAHTCRRDERFLSSRSSKLSIISVMVQSERSTFTNKRKQIISTVAYLPENIRRPKALLFFHHGYGEHIGRYERGKQSQQDMSIPDPHSCLQRSVK